MKVHASIIQVAELLHVLCLVCACARACGTIDKQGHSFNLEAKFVERLSTMSGFQ